MATMQFFPLQKPLLLFLSKTAQPENIHVVSLPIVSGIAIGRCFQCTRSVLVACPQLICPHLFSKGFCWLYKLYTPFVYRRPLGSFVQFFKGVNDKQASIEGLGYF